MLTDTPIYDRIGKTYDTTRRADPTIVEMLYQKLQPVKNGCYLDVGCGSGNYTCALAEKNLQITGVDISTEMLSKARLKNSAIQWIQSDITELPFPNNSLNGAICILATHHFTHLDLALEKIYVAMKQGNFVIFTSTPEQMQNYWLCHYFPQMMQASAENMLDFSSLKQKLLNAGFNQVVAESYFVTHTLQDWFLHAGKSRPEIYLNEAVRQGISSFAKFCCVEEQTIGLEKLKRDIDSGEINQIIKRYEAKTSDYLFVTASK